MKNILKYSLILAAASLAGAVYAQTATAPAPQVQSADGMKITSSIKNGVINIHIGGECKSKLVSIDDELKVLLKQSLETVGINSNIAKAVESAFVAIRTHISNPNEPAFGPIDLHLVVTPDEASGVINTIGDITIARDHYVANMKSVFNDDNTVTTTGNVTKTPMNKESVKLPAVVKIDANGTISSTGGDVVISEPTVSEQQSNDVVNPNAVPNNAISGNDSTLIPDNTIVATPEK